MKKFLSKKIAILPLGIIILQALTLPMLSFAQAVKTKALEYQALEGNAFKDFTSTAAKGDQLGTFLSQAFQFGLALAAALTVIMIIWGGVEYMLTDSVFSKEDGKKKIKEALLGLGLALVSWLILFTINPDILKFKLL